MNTCERLKIVRGKLSQAEFAESLGIHKNSLGRYERGESEPDFGIAEKIYTIYGVSPVWLILGVGPMRSADTSPEQIPHGQTVPAVPALVTLCPQCAELKAELGQEKAERRELSDENRELWKKNVQMVQEIGELKIEVAVQREQLKSLSGRSVATDCA